MSTKYPHQKSNASDHFQTPPEALDPLLPYLTRDWMIWEPACGKGNLVKALDGAGFRVFGSDIIAEVKHQRINFLTDGAPFIIDGMPFSFSMVLSNPPYSLKDEFLERCYQLGKPFALLLPLTVFDSVRRRKLFQKHGVECVFLPNRISFETPNHDANVAVGKKTSSWFATLWITWGLNIGKQLVFTDA
jgi:hypothetical protein